MKDKKRKRKSKVSESNIYDEMIADGMFNIEWAVVFGIFLAKKTDVVLYKNKSKHDPISELHIIKTFYVNGVQSSVEARVFVGYDMEFWMEEPEEIVEEMYPCIREENRIE